MNLLWLFVYVNTMGLTVTPMNEAQCKTMAEASVTLDKTHRNGACLNAEGQWVPGPIGDIPDATKPADPPADPPTDGIQREDHPL